MLYGATGGGLILFLIIYLDVPIAFGLVLLSLALAGSPRGRGWSCFVTLMCILFCGAICLNMWTSPFAHCGLLLLPLVAAIGIFGVVVWLMIKGSKHDHDA